MAPDEQKRSWKVLELLNWMTSHFGRAGIANARLDAEVLLSKALGMERIMLYARFDQEVTAAQRDRLRELVRRRAAREPLQYLVGEWEFFGRSFELTPAVMVPRQETELVVEKCLEKLPGDADGLWAADVCTGSGAIAVSLAAERPGLHVAATDASAEALEVARRNAVRQGVAGRVAFALGDLAEPLHGLLPEGRAGFDLLVSNPPYVPTEQIERLEPEVRCYEPRQALDGGTDGLDAFRRLVPQAAGILVPGGCLVLELGEGQASAVAQMLERAASYDLTTVEMTTDSGGCQRVLCARRSTP
jgi:release factor glutamine methyltransferase